MELRKYTDRLGRATTYAYDADQRLTSVTEPLTSSTTRTTSYDYYENGTLKDITDANGNVTHWDIDIESRPVDKSTLMAPRKRGRNITPYSRYEHLEFYGALRSAQRW